MSKKNTMKVMLKNVTAIANAMNGMVLAAGEKEKAGFGRRESVALTYAFSRGMATGAYVATHGGQVGDFDLGSREIGEDEALRSAANFFNRLIKDYPERRDHMLALESSGERAAHDIFFVKNKHYASKRD